MKKFLIMMIMTFAFTTAAANAVDLTGLTPQQVQELAAKVAEMKAAETKKEPANISTTVRQEAEAWGELGMNMGRAMVGAAKEIGLAANDFAATDLGKIVTFMVVYKYIGEEILSRIIGSIILIVGTILSIWVARSTLWYTVKYEYKPVLWGLYNKRVPIEIKTNTDETIVKVCGSAVLLVLTYVVGLKIIF